MQEGEFIVKSKTSELDIFNLDKQNKFKSKSKKIQTIYVEVMTKLNHA